MKRFSKYLFFGLGAAVLQSTLLKDWPTAWLSFNMIALTVIFLAFESEGWREDVFSVAMLGLWQDAASYAPLGTALCATLILYFLIRWCSQQIVVRTPLSRWVWVTVFMLSYSILFRCFIQATLNFNYFNLRAILQMWVQAGWNGLAALAFFPILRKFHQFSWRQFAKPKQFIFQRK